MNNRKNTEHYSEHGFGNPSGAGAQMQIRQMRDTLEEGWYGGESHSCEVTSFALQAT